MVSAGQVGAVNVIQRGAVGRLVPLDRRVHCRLGRVLPKPELAASDRVS